MNNILTDVRVKTIISLITYDPENDRCIITVEKAGWADHVLTVKGRLATAAAKWLKKGSLINVHTVSTDTNRHKVTAFEFDPSSKEELMATMGVTPLELAWRQMSISKSRTTPEDTKEVLNPFVTKS